MRYFNGQKKKVRKDKTSLAVTVFAVVFILIFAVFCLIPFMMMISASFSDENIITTQGIGIFPKGFTVQAYKILFRSPKYIIGSYAVTIILTVSGTFIGLFIIAMTGYALYRPDFPFRNKISFFFYFTTLFSAGLVPSYLWMTRYLQLRNSYLAVLLPLLMSPWLIILMRNFVKSVPIEITESGKMDGANDFSIFYHLILPMMKPALATIGLFLALNYWNEWYQSLLYIPDLDYKPLQYYLYKIVNETAALRQSLAGSAVVQVGNMPSTTLKMATAVLVTGPIIFLYPFVQRYFISGIAIGAVKG
jgi:ABC-type glycerol-3-phosphate transport system permease component